MTISKFVESYSVDLATGSETPFIKRVEWQVRELLRPQTKSSLQPYPAVDLYSWRPEGGEFVNFGDELARVIVELMLASRGASLLDQVPVSIQLVTVGSALHRAGDNAVIWGTGLHGASLVRDHTYRSLDVRAVRGPLTAKFLRGRGIFVPEVFGDPGLLLPKLVSGRFTPTGKYSIGFVPNLHDIDFIERADIVERFPGVRLIEPRRAWNTVVSDILDHDFIISSSLHGLVVADAYGIPCRYVRLTEKENILKYYDYYLGTGRKLDHARSIGEAIEKGGMPLLNFDCMPLVDAFPWDIWGM